MNISLNARLVAAICQFKAKNDIRYYLNGVYVDPLPSGGAVIVATNGHVLGLWRDPSATVERPAILRIGKRLLESCAEAQDARLQLIDGRLTVTNEQKTEYHVQPNGEKEGSPTSWEIEGKFPEWRRFIPADCHIGPMGSFNAGYVKLVHKALKIANGNPFSGITFRQADKGSPVCVLSACHPDFAAVIMPIRDEGAGERPAWINDSRAAYLAEIAANDQLARGAVPAQQPGEAVAA